jgi:hypothetical protein
MKNRITMLLVVVCSVALAAPVAASADTVDTHASIDSFTSTLSRMDAAAHGDFETRFTLNTYEEEGVERVSGGPLKTTVVNLPPGLAANIAAAPTCTMAQLNSTLGCPAASQVGLSDLRLKYFTSPWRETTGFFNLKPARGEVAAFGFNLAVATVRISVHLRPDDYGVQAVVQDVNDAMAPVEVKTVLWGSPNSPVHDKDRWPCVRVDSDGNGVTNDDDECPSTLPRVPFMTNPAHCDTPLTTGLEIDTWNHPGEMAEAVSDPFELSNCEALQFRPTIEASPTTQQPDSPTGLDLALRFPQHYDNPDGTETPPLRDAVVTLPEGMTINPASADGLESCSDSELNLGSTKPVACPAASKIGTVEAETPVISEPLEGSVYLRSQASGEPESGDMFRLALVLENAERGLSIRLPGSIRVNGRTGRIETAFADNPQLPVSVVRLNLKSGPRAPLATPSTCGTHTIEAKLTSWAGQTAEVGDSFSIACGQDRPFAPRLEAGTSNPLAGTSAPFLVRLDRGDGEPEVNGLSLALPKGLTAFLRGVPYCPEAALATITARSGREEMATPACPPASRVGSVEIGAGAGSNPFHVQGGVYLTGPYKDAPLGLAIVVPAVAGPFDLGTELVRTRLAVDPITAQVTAISDPVPTVVRGVPIRLRSIALDIDRPEFTLNPTNCEPMQITSTLTSVTGQTASPPSPFQVADCERLAFKPSLKLSLTGRTKRTGNPALKAVLTQPKGQNANIARTAVILPKSMFIDQSHVNNPCTRVQFNEGACPPKSILGTATAWSPLLEQPLTGPVYFRSNGGERQLPDLVADLNGQIHVTLVGFIDSVKVGKESSRVRTRFQSVPDAPVSRFVLQLKGGRRGLIENSKDLCRARPVAKVQMTGQNGKAHDFRQRMGVRCGKVAKKKVAKKKH